MEPRFPQSSRQASSDNRNGMKTFFVLVAFTIPSGAAHWYKEVTTPITYLEVRFVAPK